MTVAVRAECVLEGHHIAESGACLVCDARARLEGLDVPLVWMGVGTAIAACHFASHGDVAVRDCPECGPRSALVVLRLWEAQRVAGDSGGIEGGS